MSLDLRDRIRDVPDFPSKGIVFKDLMPLIADPGRLILARALAQLLQRQAAVMAQLADAPADDLGVLRTEIEDENFRVRWAF